MQGPPPAAPLPEHPHLLLGTAALAIGGCLVFALSILVADFVVPDHDWMADTISDLGAGRLEGIVDVGIYSFSAALIACAVGAAHAHLGGRGWTFGIYGLIATGLIVFLVGARNEYGDADHDGVVIHRYLVWALGALFAVLPWAMSEGVGRVSPRLRSLCRLVTVVWVPLAPLFFVVPTEIDGLYERLLGLVTFAFVGSVALALAGTGYVSATLAYGPTGRAVLRNVLGGVFAMLVTFAIGTLVGARI